MKKIVFLVALFSCASYPALANLTFPPGSSGGGGTPGGSNGQIQYNNSGTFGGLNTATASGDITIGTTGTTSVSAIQGTTVSGTTGTGNVVFSTSPSLSGVNLQINSTLTDVIDKTSSVSASTLTLTSTTTQTAAPNLNATLVTGGSYLCHGHLTGTAGASGGIAVQLAATNSLALTNISVTGANWNGTTLNAKTTATAAGASFGAATAVYTDFDIDAAMLVGTGGTLGVTAAQNVSNATSTTVLLNSYFTCRRTN